jgi:hypothetical protein
VIRDDIKIELEDIGEGQCGDYDPEDPDDTPLLRFSCYVKGKLRQQILKDRSFDLEDLTESSTITWVAVNNASFCTQLPATMDAADQARAEELLMNKLYEPITSGTDLKRTLEEASWIDPTWLSPRTNPL